MKIDRLPLAKRMPRYDPVAGRRYAEYMIAIGDVDGLKEFQASGNMPCKFCDERALYLCGWPDVQLISVPALELKIGSRVRPFKAVSDWTVCEEHRFGDQYGQPAATFFITDGKSRLRVDAFEWSRMRAWMPAVCHQGCCYSHAREVGESRHYCRDHWPLREIEETDLFRPKKRKIRLS